ncbi:MAG: LysR family transcriptional regulator [Rubrivivax sp.]|nr:MAG: LysR family transcriptional regulator [Rubrivivax sp.]
MTGRNLPPLSALRAFEAAARHASAKRAAEELHVTPTAISHQLRTLEAWLGTPLFVRRPRQLEVTAAGRELQAVLATSFDSIAATTVRLRRGAARQTATLTTTPAVAARCLMPRLDWLREHHPLLDIRIHATHELVPLDGVLADVAVRYGHGPWPGIASEPLFDNVFVPACAPSLGLVHAADLPRHTLIHFEPRGGVSGPISWAGWQALAGVPGLDPTAGPVFSDETHAVAAALAGQGVVLLSRALVTDELARGSLVQPFGPELHGAPFQLAWPRARAQDPAVLAIREWVRVLSEEMRSAGARAC